jgi:hypothetical protein
MSFSSQSHAFGREAELAADQIGLGVTALGKAGYGNSGLYSRAFFGLSVGLERLAKLVIIADYAIDNRGGFPNNTELRRIGHDIASLFDKCEAISIRRDLARNNARPNTEINAAIVKTLTEFGIRSRYYNLDLIVNRRQDAEEPIQAWWTRVGQLILSKHYSARQQARHERIAAAIGEQADSVTSVHFHDEQGHFMGDVATILRRGSENRVVQKYSRLYTLQIVRWLSTLLSTLIDTATHMRIEALAGLSEYFRVYPGQSDDYLLRRTTWPGL